MRTDISSFRKWQANAQANTAVQLLKLQQVINDLVTQTDGLRQLATNEAREWRDLGASATNQELWLGLASGLSGAFLIGAASAITLHFLCICALPLIVGGAALAVPLALTLMISSAVKAGGASAFFTGI